MVPPPPLLISLITLDSIMMSLSFLLALIVANFGVVAAPFPPPNISSPWLYFGANETGPTDTVFFQTLAARGGLAGYGWQNNAEPSNFSHGEANVYGAVEALHAASPRLPIFAYRNWHVCWRLFDIQRAADDNASLHGMFLRNFDNAPGAAECRIDITPDNSTSPFWVFENTDAGSWWVKNVVREVAAETHTAAVFFDTTDANACGYSFVSCPNISASFRTRDLLAKLPALRAAADALNAADKLPIFSSRNVVSQAWAGLPVNATRPCVIPHDAYLAALEGVEYARFYEFWMGQGANLDAAYISNVIIEGNAGVGFVARASADAHAQCTTTCDAGPWFEVGLSYSLAAFLVARTSPYSYFGVSAGWSSGCWCWHSEYDEVSKCGAPTAPAVRTSAHSWTREYEHCVVSVNTSAAEGSWTPRAVPPRALKSTAVPDPVPDSDAVVVSLSGLARFTVLGENLLRLQYASDGNFSDAPTIAVVNRRLTVPPFTINVSSGIVRISTAMLELFFNDSAPTPSDTCAAAHWMNQTDAGLPRVRSAAYPNGTHAGDGGACCAICAAQPDCAGFVFEDNGSSLCFPLASFNGSVAAEQREFGVIAPRGFSPGNLKISASTGSAISWSPGDVQTANLGGTLPWMDCYSTPAECFEQYHGALQPGLLARDGWSLLDDSLGTLRTPDGWWAAPRESLDWYFVVYDADFKSGLSTFASIMGPPEIPPRAFMGVWWSQNYPWTNISGNASIVADVLDQYAALSIPLSTLVLDMDWHRREYPEDTKACQTWGSWDFNTTAFPDPLAFITYVSSPNNALGHPLATSLNVHPQTGVYHCLERYIEFAALVNASTALNATIPCDMTDRRWVDALWRVYHNAVPLSSIDVWWTDYPDGCPSTLPGFQPPPLLWSNVVYAEQRAASGVLRPATFSRWGGLGSHRYPIGFSGDTFQHELSLDFEIQMTPQSANTLFGWWSHDIGGFHADRTNNPASCPGDSNPSNASGAELFSRWVQFGAVSPILRTHCGGCGPEGPPNCSCDRRIWMFSTHFAYMRDAMRLRAALVPHLYTAARIFYDTAVAPVRALYIDFPDEALAYSQNHTYMFGEILASPVHTFSSDGLSNVTVSVWLPSGIWVPWGGGAPVSSEGGQTYDTRAYGQNEIPLFVRADALLPLAFDGAADIAKSSPAIAWTLWDAGATDGRGHLYEDDGFSQQYHSSAGLVTAASFSWGSTNLSFHIDSATGTYDGMPTMRECALHVRGWGRTRSAPTSVLVNGVPVREGNATPGWTVFRVQPDEPALTTPNGMLQVRAGTAPLSAPLSVEIVY